jgi:hypothetical protein
MVNCVDSCEYPINFYYNDDFKTEDIIVQSDEISVLHDVNTDVTYDNASCIQKGLDCNCAIDGYSVSDSIKDHVNNFNIGIINDLECFMQN